MKSSYTKLQPVRSTETHDMMPDSQHVQNEVLQQGSQRAISKVNVGRRKRAPDSPDSPDSPDNPDPMPSSAS